ncbi:hypothetical protein F5B17DRAFT_388414 [Nemania serpens]|nr:hypothetical protein F5B17DRAFT_388414 [Nemania serpens]
MVCLLVEPPPIIMHDVWVRMLHIVQLPILICRCSGLTSILSLFLKYLIQHMLTLLKATTSIFYGNLTFICQ